MTQFREMTPESWARFVDLNLYGVLHCTRAVIDGMCARRFGRVVTISSGAGQVGLGIGVSLYAAGKGGAIAFMRHLAIEVARFGVTANSLALGLMGNTAGVSSVRRTRAHDSGRPPRDTGRRRRRRRLPGVAGSGLADRPDDRPERRHRHELKG